jgi:hypothetical protein
MNYSFLSQPMSWILFIQLLCLIFAPLLCYALFVKVTKAKKGSVKLPLGMGSWTVEKEAFKGPSIEDMEKIIAKTMEKEKEQGDQTTKNIRANTVSIVDEDDNVRMLLSSTEFGSCIYMIGENEKPTVALATFKNDITLFNLYNKNSIAATLFATPDGDGGLLLCDSKGNRTFLAPNKDFNNLVDAIAKL